MALNLPRSNSQAHLKNDGSANDQPVNLLKRLLHLAKMQKGKEELGFSIITYKKGESDETNCVYRKLNLWDKTTWLARKQAKQPGDSNTAIIKYPHFWLPGS